MLNWLVEHKQIAPHIPVIDKSNRGDGTFSRSDFRPARYVSIVGAVRAPGTLPWRDGMTLRDAILQVKGLMEDADLREAEIARDNYAARLAAPDAWRTRLAPIARPAGTVQHWTASGADRLQRASVLADRSGAIDRDVRGAVLRIGRPATEAS